MEIIIDEFHYPSNRSFFSRFRSLLRTVKKKSPLFIILGVLVLLFVRFSQKMPQYWLYWFVGFKTPQTPGKLHDKKQENAELRKKLQEFENVLGEVNICEKFHEFILINRRDILGLFSFEHLSDNLKQSHHLVDQRIAVLDLYKLELFTYKCLWFFAKHILDLLHHVKSALELKYLDKLHRKYHNAISDVDKMTDFILSEFYENLLHAGFKNLSSHIKKAISSVLQPIKAGVPLEAPKIFDLLAALENKILAFNSKDLKLPDDNKRWSSFCLSSLQQVKSKNPLHKKITFTDFNVVSTEILEIEEEDHDGGVGRPRTEPAILFPRNRGLSVPKNSMDLLTIFMGDIANHKYFIDQEYIERYIIMADKDARAERYRCCLAEIREEDEMESDSYSQQKGDENASEEEDMDEIEEGSHEGDEEDEEGEKLGQTIEEARYYFALILKMCCGEIVDWLESSNLNIYMFYALKYEFFRWKMNIAAQLKSPDCKIHDLEDWLNDIHEEIISNEEKVNYDGGCEERVKKLEKLLKDTRGQIYRSLFLSTNEYQETEYGGKKVGAGKQGFQKKRILDYLITYGVGEQI